MKIDIFVKLFLVLPILFSRSLCAAVENDFSKYPAPVYQGSLHIPDYYKNTADGWRDDDGKLVAPPVINFSGKYYIGVHSCGAECRYYSLSDLSSGKDVNALNMFSSDETPLRARDGRVYITDLISKADSALLVARYYIDAFAGKPAECREKEFLLGADLKIVPASNTLLSCPSDK
ncbi:hypothetical protein [Paraburkholderia megapolitana]|uniref:hypothetical protein n=1 Tax=Paraburkholderia megapolitana TaxID=420953 RepID=UPI0038BD8F29